METMSNFQTKDQMDRKLLMGILDLDPSQAPKPEKKRRMPNQKTFVKTTSTIELSSQKLQRVVRNDITYDKEDGFESIDLSLESMSMQTK